MLYDKRASLPMVLLIDALIGILAYTGRYSLLMITDHAAEYAQSAAISTASTATIIALIVHVSLWMGLTLTVLDARQSVPVPAVTRPEQHPLAQEAAFAQTAGASYRPNMAYLPMPGGHTVIIHVAADQLAALRRRVIAGRLGLPVNDLEKFSSSEAKRLRAEAQEQGLARVVGGNQVEWTPEAAGALIRSSPAAVVSTGKSR
jgi:hypothetical protein